MKVCTQKVYTQVMASNNWLKRLITIMLLTITSLPFLMAQTSDITGVITDTNGEPLPGVNIVIKGTTQGTVTDVDGNYIIQVNPEDILVISSIGFERQEIVVGDRTTINIQLNEEMLGVDEVVVVGYGTQKKSSVTGAISSVSNEEITKSPESNVLSAIQGKASGVSVVNNGTPGTAPTVRIRGNGSISFEADPLYIVDGIAISDITNFNSKDIESMEVLKDASATAIYGSRAANGVVLITTKQGKKDGKVRVNVNSYVGVQTVPKTLDLLNTEQYLEYGTVLNTAAGLEVPERFLNMSDTIYVGGTQTYEQTNTDWQDELFEKAIISDNNISFSTGNDKSDYYASAAYFKQDGIVGGTGYERGTFRFNSNHKIRERIKFGQTLTYSDSEKQNEQSTGGRSIIMNTIRSVPYLPVYDPTKLGGYLGAISGMDGTDPDNSIRVQQFDTDETNTTQWFATAYLEIDILKGLKFKSSIGYDYVNSSHFIFHPIFDDGNNSNSTAGLEKTTYQNKLRTITNQLSYDKTFGNHRINITAVQEDVKYSTEEVNVRGNLETNEIKQMSGLSNSFVDGTLEENRLQSYLGRVNYAFKDKYLLSASVRTDGSSKFAPGNKWGTFKAASVGWRITEESFMDNFSSISNLKLRLGYGELGNQNIGNYEWQSLIYTNTEYVLNGSTVGGAYFNSLPNEDLQWETSKMTNVGLDLGLFDNKLTFSAEWFYKVTDNLILGIPYAMSIGYFAPAFANVGEMKNYGMEFSAGYRINSGDFKSNLSANMSIVRNEVLNLLNETATIDAGIGADFGAFDQTRTVVGEPIQSFYGWKVDGIFQSDAEVAAAPTQPFAEAGDIRFKDLSGPNGVPDGEIDSYDRTFLGSYMPKFTYGLNYSGSYKNWDFSIFFQGVQGNKIFNGTKLVSQGMLRLFNAGTEVLDAWTPSNTDTDVPRAISGDPNQNARMSDRFVEDGSYLRLKTLNIGYTFNLSKSTNGNVQNLRLYVAGQNLLTWTNYTGYDPEIGGLKPEDGQSGLLINGVDRVLVPSPRTFLGGIQVNF